MASLRARSRAAGSALPFSFSGGAGKAAWYPVELITLMSSGASRPPRLVK
jgi:hypothetical protein